MAKSHPETSPEGQQSKVDAETATAGQVSELQARTDKELEQGFRGVEVDPTPNDNYTVAGVTSGAPTPETDEGQAEEARLQAVDVERRANGVAGR
jgi:hypothetical protein